MKRVFLGLMILTVIIGCSVKKKPVFLKVDDVNVLSFKSDTVKLEAKAFFKNENDIGGKISTDEVKVFVDEVEVAQVSSEEFKVPANKEFSIPLLVAIPTKKVFGNKGGLLEGLLKSVLNNSVKVKFKGDIKYKVLGFSKVYPIDKTKEIKIKL